MSSTQDRTRMPSAIISDGLVPVPLWAVTTMTLSETYPLPPIASTAARAFVSGHDDTLSLNGMLVGPERFGWKLALETLAESGRRGGSLPIPGGIGGLIVVTSMTIRTHMHVQSLSFTASAAKRDTLDVAITFAHLPPPGPMAKLIDLAAFGVSTLADWKEP